MMKKVNVATQKVISGGIVLWPLDAVVTEPVTVEGGGGRGKGATND